MHSKLSDAGGAVINKNNFILSVPLLHKKYVEALRLS
jgi:hypothetical protein